MGTQEKMLKHIQNFTNMCKVEGILMIKFETLEKSFHPTKRSITPFNRCVQI